eukprot:9082737-Alexandrium_andersonii.AAC.1
MRVHLLGLLDPWTLLSRGCEVFRFTWADRFLDSPCIAVRRHQHMCRLERLLRAAGGIGGPK